MNSLISSRDTWVDLTPYTTLSVPAKARELIKVDSVDRLRHTILRAQQTGDSFVVLGEGSNTVFVGDYDGVVIVNQIKGLKQLTSDDSGVVLLNVSAGENWHQLVTHCVDRGWYGIENLALIPGSVGAAPIQNIGAYGVEVKDSISSVEVFDTITHEVLSISNAECEFSYRESRFKKDWADNKIVLAVNFSLRTHGQLCVDYPALKKKLDANPSLKNVYAAVVSIRSEKLPDPAVLPNAGSFFKNPLVKADEYRKLKQTYPELVGYRQSQGYKLAAAWLIENAGWKSKEMDGVSVHNHQALVLVNPNHRSGVAIEAFAKAVQKDVLARYKVMLEIEPRLVK